MNTNWIAIAILYGWFLCGLYTVRLLQKDKHVKKAYLLLLMKLKLKQA